MKNQRNLFLTGLSLFIFLNLSACSTFGNGSTRTTLNPSADVNLLADSRKNFSSQSNFVSPKAIEDMRALSNQKNRNAYLIGPSDLLEIKVFQAEELSRQVRVDHQGNIALPLMGTIRVAGLSQIQLEKRLAGLLGRNLLRNPQVSVFIKEFTAQRVTVEGEVKEQGVFPITGDVTVLQAIAMSGGLGEFASANDVILFRAHNDSTRTYTIDINAIRSGKVNDPLLMNDDRIVVSRAEEKRVTVDGEVNKSGVFPYKDRITVLQAVALAEGLSNLAAPDKVAVFRREGGQEKIYSVNLTDIRRGDASDPFLQNNDRIVVHRSNSRYWLNEIAPLLNPISALTSILIR